MPRPPRAAAQPGVADEGRRVRVTAELRNPLRATPGVTKSQQSDPSEAVVHGLLAQDHNPSLDWLAVKSRVLHGSGYWHRTVTPLDGFTA